MLNRNTKELLMRRILSLALFVSLVPFAALAQQADATPGHGTPQGGQKADAASAAKTAKAAKPAKPAKAAKPAAAADVDPTHGTPQGTTAK